LYPKIHWWIATEFLKPKLAPMQIAFELSELIAIVAPLVVRGSTQATITGISALEAAKPADLSFLGNRKYKAVVGKSEASVILVPADFGNEPKSGQCLLLVENPSAALALVCARIEHLLWPKPEAGIHPTAFVDQSATVADSATVGPLCVVEAGAHIGERTHLQAQVFVGRGAGVGDDCWIAPHVYFATDCRIGNRVRIHAGAALGADGFGYEFVGGQHVKVPQIGGVVIDDDVEIGANVTIDRARFSQTRIGQGTKIDNLVQIAHNVRIGKHCLVCAQAGISGSTTLEDYVVLGGQSGVGGHITLAKGTKLGGGAELTRDTQPGDFLNGSPAMPYMLERRIAVLQKRLPELFRQVEKINEDLEELKKTFAS
jgi:UDP-3-O-[3-hydroxymyristoyl] glucosamine N-acyltransferase